LRNSEQTRRVATTGARRQAHMRARATLTVSWVLEPPPEFLGHAFGEPEAEGGEDDGEEKPTEDDLPDSGDWLPGVAVRVESW